MSARIGRARTTARPERQDTVPMAANAQPRDSVWDRMPDAVRAEARFIDAPRRRTNNGERRDQRPRRTMRQTALDGAEPAPSRREQDRQAYPRRRHGPGRPRHVDRH